MDISRQNIIDSAILDALEKGELDLDEQMEANFTKDMENGTFVLDMSEYNEWQVENYGSNNDGVSDDLIYAFWCDKEREKMWDMEYFHRRYHVAV